MISDMHMTTLLALLPDTKLVGQRNWVGGGAMGGARGCVGFRIPNMPPPALAVGRERLSSKGWRGSEGFGFRTRHPPP
jgi:hypothetical protein